MIISLKDCGARGDGEHDDSDALQEAVAKVETADGGLIVGDQSAAYVIQSDVAIASSHVRIDMRGALVTGKGRTTFDGRNGRLRGVGYRNASHVAIGDFITPRAPRLLWCDGSFLDNVTVKGPAPTAFMVGGCRGCSLTRLSRFGGRDGENADAIGILVWLSRASLVQDCTIDGNGEPLVYGIQIKGGECNRVRRCVVRNVRSGQHVRARIGIRDRGDAPWRSSSSTGPLPFQQLGPWAEPDEKRASRNTRIDECLVEDCDGHAFHSQEAIGTEVRWSTARRVTGRGFVALRLVEGLERDQRHIKCLAEKCGMEDFHAIDLETGNVPPGYMRAT